jgi:AmiR/NasT family two-component response regulator
MYGDDREQMLDEVIRIEQAKGMLFDRGAGMTMDQAFQALRSYARAHNLNLADLARAVTERTADVNAILDDTPLDSD